MGNYVQGNAVTVTGTFTNAAGAVTDPTVVTFRFKSPAVLATTAYVYGTDSQLVKDSTGVYHVVLDLNSSGSWTYRWEGTGVLEAANQGLIVCMAAAPV